MFKNIRMNNRFSVVIAFSLQCFWGINSLIYGKYSNLTLSVGRGRKVNNLKLITEWISF